MLFCLSAVVEDISLLLLCSQGSVLICTTMTLKHNTQISFINTHLSSLIIYQILIISFQITRLTEYRHLEVCGSSLAETNKGSGVSTIIWVDRSKGCRRRGRKRRPAELKKKRKKAEKRRVRPEAEEGEDSYLKERSLRPKEGLD